MVLSPFWPSEACFSSGGPQKVPYCRAGNPFGSQNFNKISSFGLLAPPGPHFGPPGLGGSWASLGASGAPLGGSVGRLGHPSAAQRRLSAKPRKTHRICCVVFEAQEGPLGPLGGSWSAQVAPEVAPGAGVARVLATRRRKSAHRSRKPAHRSRKPAGTQRHPRSKTIVSRTVRSRSA